MLDSILTGLIYIICMFVLFIIGKLLYDLLNNKFKLDFQLVKEDNLAVAISISGYYLGIVFAIGGAVIGPSHGFLQDLIDLGIYGGIAIIMMNIATVLCDKIILYKFDNTKEIIEDKNVGTGVVNFGVYVASGLIIYGAVSGQGGSIFTALAFAGLGLAVLIIAGFVYNWITPFDIHEHIEKDNVAVGVSYAGVMVAMGIIVMNAVSGDFISWAENLSYLGIEVLLGLILLPLIRVITDKVLLPGERLTKELIGQEVPNIGAGLIEATIYIVAAFLIGWSF